MSDKSRPVGHSATSRPWGWKATIHIYGSGEMPGSATLSATADDLADRLGADDFVGVDLRPVVEQPRSQGGP